MFNSNMGCIEIVDIYPLQTNNFAFNSNMGCIEIIKGTERALMGVSLTVTWDVLK